MRHFYLIISFISLVFLSCGVDPLPEQESYTDARTRSNKGEAGNQSGDATRGPKNVKVNQTNNDDNDDEADLGDDDDDGSDVVGGDDDDDDDDTTPIEEPVVLDPAANGDPNVVVFRIRPGTGSNSWNTQGTGIKAKIGQVIRIVNEDTVAHRLHTFGDPCNHGTNILPGATFDCGVERVYSSAELDPLYDHNFGMAAEVWLEITE